MSRRHAFNARARSTSVIRFQTTMSRPHVVNVRSRKLATARMCRERCGPDQGARQAGTPTQRARTHEHQPQLVALCRAAVR